MFFLDFAYAASAINFDNCRADSFVLLLDLEKLFTMSKISSRKRLSNTPSVARTKRSPSLTLS